MEQLSDEQMRAKTDEFRDRLAHGQTLDEILPEAYALVREATWRILGPAPGAFPRVSGRQGPAGGHHPSGRRGGRVRGADLARQKVRYARERYMAHFDVQMIGAIMLHWGRIAEMKTGEGKTQVAVPALYLNALEGKGAHLLTHNDYLAQRDRDWMAPIYEIAGLDRGGDPARRGRAPCGGGRPMSAISPMPPTTRSGSTTCATTRRAARRNWCCASCTSPSSTKPTRC